MADEEDSSPGTFCLSPVFAVMVQKLLETTLRDDGGSNNLRSSAYEALMDMIKHSAKVSPSPPPTCCSRCVALLYRTVLQWSRVPQLSSWTD